MMLVYQPDAGHPEILARRYYFIDIGGERIKLESCSRDFQFNSWVAGSVIKVLVGMFVVNRGSV